MNWLAPWAMIGIFLGDVLMVGIWGDASFAQVPSFGGATNIVVGTNPRSVSLGTALV